MLARTPERCLSPWCCSLWLSACSSGLVLVLLLPTCAAVLRLFSNPLLGLTQPVGPVKRGRYFGLVAEQVPLKTGRRFCVDQFRISKDFFAQRCQTGVVLSQFFPRIDVVVIVIGRSVVVKPRLHPFSKILRVIGRCILAFPKAFGHGLVIRLLQSPVEGSIHVYKPAQMDIVGELVNKGFDQN